MKQHSGSGKGYAAISATVVLWSLPTLFQFYLNRFYDPWSQNFYRYSIAFLAALPIVIPRFVRKGPRLSGALLVPCAIAAVPNVIHQVGQTAALLYIGPGAYAVFARASVILTAALALFVFPEERPLIRQWRFQIGTLLGLIGAIGMIASKGNSLGRETPLSTVLLAVAATFAWAFYAVLVKRPAARFGPVRVFGVVSGMTSLLLLPLAVIFGRSHLHVNGGAMPNVILVVSAIACITVAHVLYYFAINELGVALSQTLQLLCPIAALALSAWLFGERLTRFQIGSALVLLCGAFLATRTKPPPPELAAAPQTA